VVCMSNARLLHPDSHLRVSRLVKTSVVDVSRQPLHKRSSEVDSMSEAIARRVLTAQLTVYKHRGMDLANATFKSLAAIWHRHMERRRVK